MGNTQLKMMVHCNCCAFQREQLRDHEERVMRLEAELNEHRKQPPERGAKALVVQNYKEKDAYLNFEVSTQRRFLI